ncbi:retrovirus-related pol polyprotein from transposon TNT 1-94, partial [Tanacetum coccineum]
MMHLSQELTHLGVLRAVLSQTELTDLVLKLSKKMEGLETELKNTKQIYGKGRIIEDINLDVDTSLVQLHAAEDFHFVTPTKISKSDTVPKIVLEVQTYTRRRRDVIDVNTGCEAVNIASDFFSTTKASVNNAGNSIPVKDNDPCQREGKVVMEVNEIIKKFKKGEYEQISHDEEVAQKLYAEELAKDTARQEQEKNDLEKALELQKQLDERIKVHAFVPKDFEIEKEVMKRPGFDHQQESIKKNEKTEASGFVQKQPALQKTRGRLKRKVAKARDDKDKRQKMQDDLEKLTLMEYVEVISDSEEIISVIPLAVKSPIVNWKSYCKGDVGYYEIHRADGSFKTYIYFSEMLNDFDREDLIVLYRLFNEKYASTRPGFDDLVLWGDMKIMFEPDGDDAVSKNHHSQELIEWKLYDSYGVHSLILGEVSIHMLVEKKYPLPQDTLTRMLQWKLHVNYNVTEMAYELLSFSDNVVYAFMVENPNGSNLIQQDLEQIHKDDLEAMDLKWQLSLLSMRAKRWDTFLGSVEHQGIKREYSVVRTPQQNGVAERRNETLIEAARTMLADSKLPTTFWAEAVSTACYVQNRVLVVKPHNKTPYELFRGKFDGKSDEWILLEYSRVVQSLMNLQCKKQTVVATSTTEAEYVAAASCCGQVLWIQNQMLNYGYNFINTMIHIDNNSTICIIENPVQHSKTKHIEIRHHFIRDCNAKRLIQMVKIDTEHNVADLLTKGFDAGSTYFDYLKRFGMENGDTVPTLIVEQAKLKLDLVGKPVDHTDYRNADHAGCHLDRKSTSGSVQFLGDKLVCWSSKKQNCVSISTAESEYVAVSGCCAQVLWMRTQLTDYGFFFDKVPIYCDSKSAIAISCNPVQHTRTKHIDVRYHFIKDHVEKGTIELYFVGTEFQLADLFTKSLPEARFKFLVEKLAIRGDVYIRDLIDFGVYIIRDFIDLKVIGSIIWDFIDLKVI